MENLMGMETKAEQGKTRQRASSRHSIQTHMSTVTVQYGYPAISHRLERSTSPQLHHAATIIDHPPSPPPPSPPPSQTQLSNHQKPCRTPSSSNQHPSHM